MNGEWNQGIAITPAKGLYDVRAIYPRGSVEPLPKETPIWEYELLWSQEVVAVA